MCQSATEVIDLTVEVIKSSAKKNKLNNRISKICSSEDVSECFISGLDSLAQFSEAFDRWRFDPVATSKDWFNGETQVEDNT